VFSIVLTTVGDRREAARMAEDLVSEGLAACVSAIPGVTSVYRWRGKMERAREVMLFVKTSGKRLDGLISRIKELHSYEVPEILVLKVERGLPEYLRWMEGSLSKV
jgi:periplasmic divalent cation tolerance protein